MFCFLSGCWGGLRARTTQKKRQATAGGRDAKGEKESPRGGGGEKRCKVECEIWGNAGCGTDDGRWLMTAGTLGRWGRWTGRTVDGCDERMGGLSGFAWVKTGPWRLQAVTGRRMPLLIGPRNQGTKTKGRGGETMTDTLQTRSVPSDDDPLPLASSCLACWPVCAVPKPPTPSCQMRCQMPNARCPILPKKQTANRKDDHRGQ